MRLWRSSWSWWNLYFES